MKFRLIRTWSPAGLLQRALALAIAYLILLLLDARRATAFLSGTPADAEAGAARAWLGALFFLVHGLCWTLVPVLVLAAGILRAWEHRLSSVPPGESSP